MAINNINVCIGCGICVKTCPTDVIRLNIEGKAEDGEMKLEKQPIR
ncbi:MAG: 4Fe-4S dicluster domain-containing protein [Clostridia bacterium]|nr:4Fe-4S dicluster domain-containing protein [Clostridia bacterium]